MKYQHEPQIKNDKIFKPAARHWALFFAYLYPTDTLKDKDLKPMFKDFCTHYKCEFETGSVINQ